MRLVAALGVLIVCGCGGAAPTAVAPDPEPRASDPDDPTARAAGRALWSHIQSLAVTIRARLEARAAIAPPPAGT